MYSKVIEVNLTDVKVYNCVRYKCPTHIDGPHHSNTWQLAAHSKQVVTQLIQATPPDLELFTKWLTFFFGKTFFFFIRTLDGIRNKRVIIVSNTSWFNIARERHPSLLYKCSLKCTSSLMSEVSRSKDEANISGQLYIHFFGSYSTSRCIIWLFPSVWIHRVLFVPRSFFEWKWKPAQGKSPFTICI